MDLVGKLRRLLEGWQAFWNWARQRFAIVFVVGLAMSIASILDQIRFLIDAWQSVVSFAKSVGGLGDLLELCGRVVSQGLEWWRAAIRPVFVWLGSLVKLRIPEFVQDVASIGFFAFARGANAYGRWRESLAEGRYRHEVKKLGERYKDDRTKLEAEVRDFAERMKAGPVMLGVRATIHVTIILIGLWLADWAYLTVGTLACLAVVAILIWRELVQLHYRLYSGEEPWLGRVLVRFGWPPNLPY